MVAIVAAIVAAIVVAIVAAIVAVRARTALGLAAAQVQTAWAAVTQVATATAVARLAAASAATTLEATAALVERGMEGMADAMTPIAEAEGKRVCRGAELYAVRRALVTKNGPSREGIGARAGDSRLCQCSQATMARRAS